MPKLIEPHPTPRQIKEGMYLYDGHTIYRIIAENGLKIKVASIDDPEGDTKYFETLEILKSETGYVLASSIRELKAKLETIKEESFLPPESDIPKEFLDKADEIIELVDDFTTYLTRAYEAQNGKVIIVETLDEYLAQPRISKSRATYYNYKKAYDEGAGNRLRIAGKMRRSTYGIKKLSKAQSHLLDILLLDYAHLDVSEIRKLAQSVLERTNGMWLNPKSCDEIPQDLLRELLNPKIPIEAIFANHEKYRNLSKIKLPGRTSFYEYCSAFKSSFDCGEEYVDKRYGKGTWEKHFMQFNTFVHSASAPLQYVFMDHYLLDIFDVDEESRTKGKRLWLTIMIDCYTRCILGFALLYEHPSIKSFFSVAHNAIWPKTIHEKLGIKGAWHGHGTPVQLSLDNAWAHHSKDVSDFAREFRIDLAFRPPYKARYGAIIERYFGNLARKIKTRLRNAGSIPSSDYKGIKNAAQTACLLYEDILRFLVEEFVSYQNTSHSELNGLSPNEKWLEEKELHGIAEPPEETPANQRMFWRGLDITRSDEHGKGIHAFGMTYTGRSFQARSHVSPTTGQALEYRFRADFNDISRLAVFQGMRYVCDIYANELKLPDGTYLAVSLAEREIAKKLAALAGSKNVGRDWLTYVNGLKDTTAERKMEQKKAQKSKKKAQKSSANSGNSEGNIPSSKQVDDKTYFENTQNAAQKFWD